MDKEVINSIQELFEEAGYDLENDNQAAELCDACWDVIKSAISGPQEAVLFATEVVYKMVNPTREGDPPSVAYEQMEVKYKQWKKNK